MSKESDRTERTSVVFQALRCLRQRYARLELIGSWVTDEAHIPQPHTARGWCRSFSDIDLVYGGMSTRSLIPYVQNTLQQACDDSRLTIKGISVRSAADIEGMPHSLPYNGRWPKLSPLIAIDFLRFWTAVSLTEVICLQQSQQNRSTARLYGCAKFLFTFARNVALLRGIELRSYQDIARWAGETVQLLHVDLALDIKLGRTENIDVTLISKLLSEGVSEILQWACLPLVDEIGLMSEDMRSFLMRGAELEGDAYLKLARASAYAPALTRVIAHQTAKCAQQDP